MRIAFYPINKTAEVIQGDNLLQSLVTNEFKIRSVCRGRGICATCQVKVRSGMDQLSPRTPQESKTLSIIPGADASTRLACQCRILGEGITLELPSGVYVEKLDDLLELVGEVAVSDYLHPVNGSVMIPKSKVITRSQLMLFKNLSEEISRIQSDA
jgi:ferredoxin